MCFIYQFMWSPLALLFCHGIEMGIESFGESEYVMKWITAEFTWNLIILVSFAYPFLMMRRRLLKLMIFGDDKS